MDVPRARSVRRLFPRSPDVSGLDPVLGEAAERLNGIDPPAQIEGDRGELRPVLRVVREEESLPRADGAE